MQAQNGVRKTHVPYIVFMDELPEVCLIYQVGLIEAFPSLVSGQSLVLTLIGPKLKLYPYALVSAPTPTILKPSHPLPQDVTVFGDGAFEEVIKLKWVFTLGPHPI